MPRQVRCNRWLLAAGIVALSQTFTGCGGGGGTSGNIPPDQPAGDPTPARIPQQPPSESTSATPVYATTGIHVSPSGSDSVGDGSAVAPYATIQHVLDGIAGPGDTVLLHGGVFAGPIRIRHSNLTLQALAGQSPHVQCTPSIDADDPVACIEIDAETTGVTLRGLEVSGGFYAVFLGSQWDYDDTPQDNAAANHVLMEDMLIHHSGRDAVKIPAGCDDVTIRHSDIHHSGAGYPPGTALEDMNAEGIDAVNSDRLRISDVYIHDAATTCAYVKGGSISTVIERVHAQRCGEMGLALGFDTSPEFFDTVDNPGYYENLAGVIRNSLVEDTGYAGIGLFASRDAHVLHNTLRRTATLGHSALYLGVATQDYDPDAGRPANLRPVIIGNVVDQTGLSEARCAGIRYLEDDSLGSLDGLAGEARLQHNLYYAGGLDCQFDDQRPTALLEGGNLTAWQARLSTPDSGSLQADPQLDSDGRLQAGSPAIDLAGETAAVTRDRDAIPRAAPFDAGADEF